MASKVMIIILRVVVALLAVASAVLGFIAKATKLTPGEIQFDESAGVCIYPAKPTYALGICALALLVAAMVISTSTLCFGCVKSPHGGGGASWSRLFKAFAYCVLSWISAAPAMALYVRGAVAELGIGDWGVRWNSATTRDAVLIGLRGYGCHYFKGKGFETAAVLTLVAGALGSMSFTMILTPAPAAEAEPKHDGQQPASVAPPPPQASVAHAQV